MRYFSVFSTFVGLLVLFFELFGWEYDPLKDPTVFSLVTFALLGNAVGGLYFKWKARNIGTGGPRDNETEELYCKHFAETSKRRNTKTL